MTNAPETERQSGAWRPNDGDETRPPTHAAQNGENREESAESSVYAARRASLNKEIRAGWRRALGH